MIVSLKYINVRFKNIGQKSNLEGGEVINKYNIKFNDDY